MKAPHRLAGAHEAVLAALLAALAGFAAWRDPSFLSLDAQLELSTHAFEMGLLALPMTLIIISGGIDLSIGSIMALSGVTFGMLADAGTPLWVAAIGAVVVGTLAGFANGAFVARLGVHPLIVTLASLAAYRGFAEGISRARPVSGFPDGFLLIGSGKAAGVPVPLLLYGFAAGLAVFVASRTTLGFRVYAIGDNERAARYAGVPVERIKILLYTLSGFVAALAGLVAIARRNTAKADLGSTIELEVITAVVLGGVSIFGGRGRMLGAILGVVLIHEAREFISWHWAQDEVILIVIGFILIVSVLLNNIACRARSRQGV